MPQQFIEPICDPNNSRRTLLPINPKYKKIWDLYKEQQKIIWHAEELDYSTDKKDFDLLNENEKKFIKKTISFFAFADDLVVSNIFKNLKKKITVVEYLRGIALIEFIEGVHMEVYSKLLDTVADTDEEKDRLNNEWKKDPILKKIEKLCMKYEDEENLGLNIIAFSFLEGVLFSGAFASIHWLKTHGKKMNESGKQFMSALCQSNEFIAKDEGIHVKFGVEIYKHIVKKVDEKKVHELAKEFTEVAKEFAKSGLEVKLKGINYELMASHIEYHCNSLLQMFGYKKLYKGAQQLDYMEGFGHRSKTNFFERRVFDYQNEVKSIDKIKINNSGELKLSDDF